MLSDPGATFTAAFMLGLLGGAHCITMCGGLASALGMQTSRSAGGPMPLILAYNAGRLASYAMAGLILGFAGLWLSQQVLGLQILRSIAGIMLILMGCYLGQWFNGLILTEKLGQWLWRYIAPLGKGFLPIRNIRSALVVGLVWGWLPCGLVYSALVYASVQASPASAALTMLAFGAGTLPAMLLTGFFAQQLKALIQRPGVRHVSGIAMILFGLWTLPMVHGSIMGIVH